MGRTSDARQRILGAAQRLIEQRGYSSLGVAEICTTAGVPKGSFYYFFESKEALARAVIDEQWAGQLREWEEILSSGADPLERLRRLIESTEQLQRSVQANCGTVTGCIFGEAGVADQQYTGGEAERHAQQPAAEPKDQGRHDQDHQQRVEADPGELPVVHGVVGRQGRRK